MRSTAQTERPRALVSWFRRPAVIRATRLELTILGLLYLADRFLHVAPLVRTVGFDAYSYWAIDPVNPYAIPVGSLGAFPYPPALLRVFMLASNLSWTEFWWMWSSILVATVVWLGWRRTLLLLAFPPVALELYNGNLNLLIAAAIALGFRYPATWAFVLLSKVTPGVGLVWFAVRREWRSLAIALSVAGVIAGVSVMVDARWWADWIHAATQASGEPLGLITIPLWLRLPIAVAVVAWGARTDRKWTVPVASTIAMPVLWLAAFSVLAALAAIDRPELQERTARGGHVAEADVRPAVSG